MRVKEFKFGLGERIQVVVEDNGVVRMVYKVRQCSFKDAGIGDVKDGIDFLIGYDKNYFKAICKFVFKESDNNE